MKIISLESENIKRINAIEIDFKGNLVQIAGENGEGKTSALDSIWWALEGAKNIQDKPIRKGAKEAHIRLTLGDKEVKMIVTREFKEKKNGEITTKLIISNPDGSDYVTAGGAQQMLDTLIGALTFDPLKFAMMDSKAQFNALRAFVPEVDFEAIARANEKDYEERKDVNREAKSARTQAEAITGEETSLTAELIDDEKLLKDLEKASTFNADILERANNRKALAQEAEDKFELSKQITIEATNKINELKKEIEEVNAKAAKRSVDLLKEVQEIKTKLASLSPLPELINIGDVSDQINHARKNNAAVKLRDEKNSHIAKAEKLEQQSQELTDRMEKREEDKRKAIATAKIPVTNLSFGQDAVLLDGQPFEQASEAQKMIASMELGIAQNPTLRVIFIRQGSLMSEKTKQLALDIAKKNDFLVIMESVGNQSKIGTVVEIQDGRVKKQEETL